VTTLLADPAFVPLELWLDQRNEDETALQTAVDQFLDQSRKLASNNPW
jgi:hypothetical protein